jgi:hypothetical protein
MYKHGNFKNLTGGAGTGYGLPLDVFADLHKRKNQISLEKSDFFLHKNGKRACSYDVSA